MGRRISTVGAVVACRALLAVLVAATVPPAGPVHAAQAVADQSDEIKVTARRRVEALNDVPISMSVLSASDVELRDVSGINALERMTPNLILDIFSATTMSIRGITQQSAFVNGDPVVGLYVDDVFISRPAGAILDILDLDHVEVLRGPQGTFYGRNTLGGAIKYVTRKIQSAPYLKLRVEGGMYDEHNFIVSGSTPVTDTLSISGGFAYYKHDGFGTNHFTSAPRNNRDTLTGRATVEWQPTPDLFFRASYDRLTDKSNLKTLHRETVEPNTGQAVYANKYDTNSELGDYSKIVTEGSSLLGQWTTSDQITLKTITAFRRNHIDSSGLDFDGTPQPIFEIATYGGPSQSNHQFSEELQAQFQTYRLQGVAGLYYVRATGRGAFDTILGRIISPAPIVPVITPFTALTQNVGGVFGTKSFAAYGDVNVNITDRLTASAGGRWTEDKRSGALTNTFYAFAIGSPLQHPYAPPFPIAPIVYSNYTNQVTFKVFTPRASLTYKLAPNLNTYAAYAKGFTSGGFDINGSALQMPAVVNGFGPERVDSYEIGLKGSLLDQRINFSAALFDAEYGDLQYAVQVPSAGPPPVSLGGFLGKGVSATIRGGELEGAALLAKEWTLNATLGYANAKFDRYVNFVPNGAGGFVANDQSGQLGLGKAPKWNGSVVLTWAHDLDGGLGNLTVDAAMNFRSMTHFFQTPEPLIDQPAYQLYDADLVWTSENDRWRFALRGRNLGDKRYRTDGSVNHGATFGDSVAAFYGPPRTVKASVEFRY
ncbi:MAG: TonB-dependent receptor [Rhodospirillaceae bacterium]|nr:MAG: TonB-dependent receptor [Rhodospirillaceae bacterium]